MFMNRQTILPKTHLPQAVGPIEVVFLLLGSLSANGSKGRFALSGQKTKRRD